jgi:S1-C subfamily serine protease
MLRPARRRILALGLLGGLLPLQAWADFPGTIARVKQSVVAVGTYVPVGNPRFRFLGTGFVVGDGNRVVTNAHVLASVPEGATRSS